MNGLNPAPAAGEAGRYAYVQSVYEGYTVSSSIVVLLLSEDYSSSA
jgi:hypothetical protein